MAEQGDTPTQSGQHRNDMYGNIDARSEDEAGVAELIPAATVVLLRDTPQGAEVLMLKKLKNYLRWHVGISWRQNRRRRLSNC
ncbi:MAG: hypothetical protein CM15mP120_20390 [Pseudomonadota bacterium]|nr:MAG: hypothetical protein CM15mP120_20390 [Pseudomonadota bacterium]